MRARLVASLLLAACGPSSSAAVDDAGFVDGGGALPSDAGAAPDARPRRRCPDGTPDDGRSMVEATLGLDARTPVEAADFCDAYAVVACAAQTRCECPPNDCSARSLSRCEEVLGPAVRSALASGDLAWDAARAGRLLDLLADVGARCDLVRPRLTVLLASMHVVVPPAGSSASCALSAPGFPFVCGVGSVCEVGSDFAHECTPPRPEPCEAFGVCGMGVICATDECDLGAPSGPVQEGRPCRYGRLDADTCACPTPRAGEPCDYDVPGSYCERGLSCSPEGVCEGVSLHQPCTDEGCLDGLACTGTCEHFSCFR